MGRLQVRQYDFYSQALSKIERGFTQDISDAREMVRRSLLDAEKLLRLADEIVPELPRYPAVDPDVFLRSVRAFVADLEGEG